MKAGNLKLFIATLFFVFFARENLYSEQKINLNILQPTFEEETENNDSTENESSNIKTKRKKQNTETESIVKLRALDKITAKTEDIKIVIGKKKDLVI